jgi:hypothetical protein
MIDTTPITTEIIRLIVSGTPEGDLIVRVARKFPELTRAEFFVALQDATAPAERRVVSKH